MHLSFTLSLDRATYVSDGAAAHMAARLTLRSTVAPPIVLEFFSLQRYDLVIINGKGTKSTAGALGVPSR